MSPDQLIALVADALRNGVTTVMWLPIVLALCAGAVGGFAGAYLRRKAEQTASDEHFNTALAQLERQTQSLETIRSSLARDAAASIENIKAALARDIEGFKLSLQDQLRRQSEVLAFRYTKAYAALEAIAALPAVDYTYLRKEGDEMVQDRALFKKVVEGATERYGSVMEVYKRVHPLLDSELVVEPDELVSAAESQSNLMTMAIYSGTELPEGIDVVTLLQARQAAEVAIRSALAQQLRDLTAIAK